MVLILTKSLRICLINLILPSPAGQRHYCNTKIKIALLLSQVLLGLGLCSLRNVQAVPSQWFFKKLNYCTFPEESVKSSNNFSGATFLLPNWNTDSKKFPEDTVWGALGDNLSPKVLIWSLGAFQIYWVYWMYKWLNFKYSRIDYRIQKCCAERSLRQMLRYR